MILQVLFSNHYICDQIFTSLWLCRPHRALSLSFSKCIIPHMIQKYSSLATFWKLRPILLLLLLSIHVVLLGVVLHLSWFLRPRRMAFEGEREEYFAKCYTSKGGRAFIFIFFASFLTVCHLFKGLNSFEMLSCRLSKRLILIVLCYMKHSTKLSVKYPTPFLSHFCEIPP